MARHTRRFLFAAALLALLMIAPALAMFGSQVALDARDGEIVEVIADSSLPGYQALVVPTPTSLLVHRGPTGDLTGAALLVSGSDAGGGAVLRLPVATLVGEETTLADAYAADGVEAVRLEAQQLLDMAIDSVVELDRARWTQLLAPVEPLKIANTDELTEIGPDGAMTVAFEATDLSLRAQDAARFLELRVDGESEAAQQHRVELFWRAWFDAVAASGDPGVVPGEVSTGVGRFIREMSGGYVRHEVLPVDPIEPLSPDVEGEVHWRVRDDALDELLVELVPFPIGAQLGDRIRVRLLDGVGDPDLALSAAQLLVPAGVELTIYGNADRFTVEDTVIAYHRPEFADSASRLAQEIGASTITFVDRPDAVVDITVTVGADFVPALMTRTSTRNMPSTDETAPGSSVTD